MHSEGRRAGSGSWLPFPGGPGLPPTKPAPASAPNPNSGWAWSPAADPASAVGPLTGPEAAVGAHQAHDDAAGQGPGERRHCGERPFHVEGHLPPRPSFRHSPQRPGAPLALGQAYRGRSRSTSSTAREPGHQQAHGRAPQLGATGHSTKVTSRVGPEPGLAPASLSRHPLAVPEPRNRERTQEPGRMAAVAASSADPPESKTAVAPGSTADCRKTRSGRLMAAMTGSRAARPRHAAPPLPPRPGAGGALAPPPSESTSLLSTLFVLGKVSVTNGLPARLSDATQGRGWQSPFSFFPFVFINFT